MIWTAQRVLDFKYHFGLTDAMIGKSIGVSHHAVNNMINGITPADKYASLLTAYLESVRAGKIAEHQTMIDYYLKF